MNTYKNNGLEFVGFILIPEEEMFHFQSIAGSFAVIRCSGKYLLCYNIWRQQWELPAGQREGNESPKECAMRELYEETGQTVSDMEFKGMLVSKNIMTGKLKFNPVFFTTVEEIQPFIENEETKEIKLWDLKEEIGSIDLIDSRLLENM